MSQLHDLICITSSDDEDKLTKETKYSKKRKLSVSSSSEEYDNERIKKIKDSNDSNISNSLNKFESPKPGTSKQFDEIENKFTRKKIKPVLIVKEKVSIPDPSEDIFLKFIEACTVHPAYEESTQKILEKLKNKYELLEPEDKNNEEFRLFLNGRLQKILDKTERYFTNIVQVKEEIQRRVRKPKIIKMNKVIDDESAKDKNFNSEEKEEEMSITNLKKIKKLEFAIEKCKSKIKQLEEEEVNFDDEEDSAYLKEDRYKRKLVELCHELSKLAGDNALMKQINKQKIRRKDITDEMTNIESVDEAIINFINSDIKKLNQLKHIKNPNAVADYFRVPDYQDILKIITKQNEEKCLNLSQKKIEHLAKTAFKSVGKYFKKKRLNETQEYISSCIDDENEDPAKTNAELNIKLQKNREEGEKKLNAVFQMYVQKQEGFSIEELQNESNSTFESEAEEIIENNKSMDENINKFEPHNKVNKKSEIDESRKDELYDKNSDIEECKKNNSKNENRETRKSCDESGKVDSNEKLSQNKHKNESDEILDGKIEATENISDDKHCMNSIQPKNILNISSISRNNSLDHISCTAEDEIVILSGSDEDCTNNIKSKPSKSSKDHRESTDIEEIVLEFDSLGSDEKEDPLCIDKMTAKETDPVELLDKITNSSIETSILDTPSSKSDKSIANQSVTKCTDFAEIIPKTKYITSVNNNINKNIEDKLIQNNSNKNKLKLPINDKTPEKSNWKKDVNILKTKSSNCADEDEYKEKGTFIKVKSFAKPPDSWKDSLSPEKSRTKLNLPLKQVLQNLPKQMPKDSSKREHRTLVGSNNAQNIHRSRIISPKSSNVVVNRISSNSGGTNHRYQTNLIRKPYNNISRYLTKK